MPEQGHEPGAHLLPDGSTRFLVWAPKRHSVSLVITGTHEKTVPMQKTREGWFECVTLKAPAGTRYLFELDTDERRPDPASRSQPEGVHGPSEVVDHCAFKWGDINWKNLLLEDYIFYELHVGTFTPEGTFDAIIPHLPYLKDLGLTAVELMPVAQFPGTRNWGYDCTYIYAAQNSYGGPEGLKRLVDAMHREGLAVVLDVVYNHLGPEGNYLDSYGPYFTDRYQTPWGDAIDFDGPDSRGVRDYFISNALAWARDFHIDALRLDAIHGIFDNSSKHILKEMAEVVRSETGMYLIAESDLNDPRVVESSKDGGHGLHAQWNDDFHHALHTLLTNENTGYYMDFGHTSHLAKALREGFVYSGQHSAFRGKSHGGSTAHIDPWRMVVFSQNHDQVGNRAQGDRLTASLSPVELRLAASLVVLSPSLPLIFMGEEYAEKNPFQYFVDHGDADLLEAVRNGRRNEFQLDGTGISIPETPDPPDPADEETFTRSRLDHSLRKGGRHSPHKEMLEFYRAVIALRGGLPALRKTPRNTVKVYELEVKKTLVMTVSHAGQRLLYLINLSRHAQSITIPAEAMGQPQPQDKQQASLLLDSSQGLKGSGKISVTIREDMEIEPSSIMIFELLT
ncbi:MAG: malto-oligosyltrehalose trehalohydrolase [Thermodesulfovibrionales bacterium]|nr:malto-oligosyltrehalose trehalohydrolase [Thermodesulfovibrionales bacterium]